MSAPKRLMAASATLLLISFLTAVSEPSVLRSSLFRHPWVVIAIGWISHTAFWLGMLVAATAVLAWLGDRWTRQMSSNAATGRDNL